MTSVVVVGSINLDVVVSCERFPRPGDTVPGSAVSYGQGGKGANQARAAARAGASATFIGAVGDDDAADRVMSALSNDVHVRASRAPGQTGVALVTVDTHGENTIVVVPGANSLLTLSDEDRRVISASDVLLVQLEVPVPVVLDAARAAQQAGTTAMLNPSPVIDLPADLWPLIDVAVVNRAEAHALRSPLDGVGTVVTTVGADGAELRGPDGLVRADGIAVAVADTTGAGDAFAGMLAASWHLPPAERLARANAAGALATTISGAASAPTAADVDAFLRTTHR
ncbi:PfkB family carbohydrate kinase [Gordonia sp. HY285]|uniref:PfkB family carbohydrate kinase n=1 Tax=Gordonia liuliyuniae TaxID=2911517 RepID=UPI001F3CD7DB|nr:PfkB family carbohydrate kinase [Gordonia liuliyuniae]MCF8611855.1 PfkB family carbohydrate kinase [Gordonia liuliyuniae]